MLYFRRFLWKESKLLLTVSGKSVLVNKSISYPLHFWQKWWIELCQWWVCYGKPSSMDNWFFFFLHRPLVLWFDCHTVTPRKCHRIWKRHHKRCPKLHELPSWLAALHHGHLGPKPWSFWLVGAYFCVFCCNGPHNVLQICPKKLGKTTFCLSHSWSQSSPWQFTTW